MRHLIDVTDFSTSEITQLLDLADKMFENPSEYRDILHGKILGTLFFEPSTRTRLSFESAMLSLGGSVLGFSSAASSSTSKGETLSDTIHTVSCYCDIIATRSPYEGAAMAGSFVSEVPIINAGDGGHKHPTQTLTDLMTIRREKHRLSNMVIGICGDLKYGRTVHSLIDAMSRYEGISYVLISPQELQIPEYVRQSLREKNIRFCEVANIEEALPSLDILYMTRVQRERFSSEAEYERLKDTYVLSADKLVFAKPDLTIMHPLPRVNEISPDVDSDPRAAYFKQVKNGRYVRMALIYTLLTAGEKDDTSEQTAFSAILVDDRMKCGNSKCVTAFDHSVPQRFRSVNGRCRCVYCDWDANR